MPNVLRQAVRGSPAWRDRVDLTLEQAQRNGIDRRTEPGDGSRWTLLKLPGDGRGQWVGVGGHRLLQLSRSIILARTHTDSKTDEDACGQRTRSPGVKTGFTLSHIESTIGGGLGVCGRNIWAAADDAAEHLEISGFTEEWRNG